MKKFIQGKIRGNTIELSCNAFLSGTLILS